MRLVDNLIAYIDDNRNPYRQVGTLLTVEEPTVAQQIAEFNKLQVQRATLLPTTPRSNPMMVTLEAAIEKLRQDILQNLRNVRRGYQLAIENLNARSRTANQLMSKVPGQQRELLDITRRQQILEQLYQFLLEKKLETAISSASTISSVKVLEPARSSRFPIRPNRQGAYMFAVLLGLGLPLFITFLREYLNDKVRSRQDVVRSTQAPIIGEIGHSLGMDTLVVSSSSRRFISEQFKIIRTNLQYVLPAKEKMVILVTSSTSGEGKSFVATNMGAVVALSGKKTAILEFDIRKPKIMSGLGLGKRKGVTNYIIGGIPFEDLAVKVPGVDNLDVIPCGPVPPNPSELLLDDRLNQFMNRLKEHYDVIIIDTAPVGLVGDAIVIGNHADVSLYVIRHNYTYRKQLQLMDEIYSTKRLPRLCIVLNDIQGHFGGYGGYYGYGGYGYGNYGYGYGKDYFDKESTGLAWLRTGFLGRLFNRG
jgi:capsular exopolysaccharide synthesis family protein